MTTHLIGQTQASRPQPTKSFSSHSTESVMGDGLSDLWRAKPIPRDASGISLAYRDSWAGRTGPEIPASQRRSIASELALSAQFLENWRIRKDPKPRVHKRRFDLGAAQAATRVGVPTEGRFRTCELNLPHLDGLEPPRRSVSSHYCRMLVTAAKKWAGKAGPPRRRPPRRRGGRRRRRGGRSASALRTSKTQSRLLWAGRRAGRISQ